MDKRGKKSILLALPMLSGNLLFFSIPFFWIVYMSFTFGLDRQWVGVRHYVELLSNPTFQLASVNTVKYATISIPILILISLLSALIIKRTGRLGRMLLFTLLIPMTIPSSGVAVLLQALSSGNGPVGKFVLKTVLHTEPLVNSPALFGIYVFIYIWRNIGCTTLIFFIALLSIPKTYYNNARVDGAGTIRRFLSITLPQLGPSFFLTSLISIMRLFESFRDMLVISGTHPINNVYMLQHFIYNNLKNINLARLSTATILLFLPIFLVILCLSPTIKRLLLAKGFLQINQSAYMERNRVKVVHFIPVLALMIVSSFPLAYFIQGSIGEWSRLFTDQITYLLRFANSMLLTIPILIGNICIACAAGFCYAKLRFRFHAALLFIMTLSALLPLHVTLSPNYIVLDRLKLIGSYSALIIPQLFAPRSVFYMTLIFSNISTSMIRSARVDGAGVMNLLCRVAVPNSKFGILSIALLTFIDTWNMVEQPMAFLSTIQKYPLAVYLSTVENSANPVLHALTVISMLPALVLLFLAVKLFKTARRHS